MSLIVCNQDNHWETKSFLEAKLKDISGAIERGEELEVGQAFVLTVFLMVYIIASSLRN
jgi:hypothetical protein